MKLDALIRDEIQRRELDAFIGEVEFREIINLAIEDGFRVKHAIDYVLKGVLANQCPIALQAA